MARLDAAHRRHLVERYFPNASHQVLILSTDTEVDRHYYQALQPHIARAYHLRYDEETRARRTARRDISGTELRSVCSGLRAPSRIRRTSGAVESVD